MEDYKPNDNKTFAHISELLQAIDESLISLHDEAATRLINKDLSGYIRILQSQAETIASMSERLEMFKKAGGHVPDDIQVVVDTHSVAARNAIEDGTEYSIAALFDHRRTKSSTVLGELALRFMPQ